MRAVPITAKEYVESLHQNNKSTLLYGKNNVMVQPVSLLLESVTHTFSIPVVLIMHDNVRRCLFVTNKDSAILSRCLTFVSIRLHTCA